MMDFTQGFTFLLWLKSDSRGMDNGAASCVPTNEFECRNKSEALKLKAVAMVTILVTGAFGVALPLLGKRLKVISTDGNVFYIAKALAAGVILATGFVHILPDAMEDLTNECLAEYPWRKFPFAGFIAMLSALGTLVIDFAGTEYFERKHAIKEQVIVDTTGSEQYDSIFAAPTEQEHLNGGIRNNMHIVGMRAHASSHRHSHPEGHHSCIDTNHAHSHAHFGHASEDELTTVRHVVISQAGFKSWSTVCMAVFFSVTTPVGIGIGIGLSEIYKANSPKALILEGIFGSISAGILVYMSLVDLIAADFISKRMRCDQRLQLLSYLALFAGALSMSSLALWA